jgi:hypothetical protein
MTNLTLAVDEELLRASRKVAIDRNTTVNRLVRDYLEQLVNGEERRRRALARLSEYMDSGLYRVGPRDWSRDDLHER